VHHINGTPLHTQEDVKTHAEQSCALYDPGGKPMLVAIEYLIAGSNACDVQWQTIDVESAKYNKNILYNMQRDCLGQVLKAWQVM
jgi:hypothetical protein